MTTGALALSLLLSSAEGSPSPTGIRWEYQLDEALRRAKAQKKPILVDFWAKWCGWCKRLDVTTYVDPVVTKMAEGFVPLKVNAEGTAQEAAFAQRYDVSTLPTIAFLTPAGHLVTRINGYQGPGHFPRTLEMAQDEIQKVMAWEAALEKNRKDPVALASLGTHLFEQEFYDEARELLGQATRFDRDRSVTERRRTRMQLAVLQNYERKYSEAVSLLKEALDLQPAGDDEPKLLFILGRTYVSWGRRSEAIETMQVIVREYGQNPFAQKARDTMITLERKPEGKSENKPE